MSVRVGELRPSQVLLTYGVGALADLPNLSAVITGLEDWPVQPLSEITEDRLLASVREELGNQVLHLMAPPRAPEEASTGSFDDPANLVGVPVASFPRWLVCPHPHCRLLAPISSGLFELKTDLFRPDRARYQHRNCFSKSPTPALPIRFLTACSFGHLDDFPWVDYVHKGQPCAHPELRFLEQGSGDEPTDLVVRCTQCEARRSMAEALERDGPYQIACTGRRPHLRDYAPDGCRMPMRVITLGASNTWFPALLTALTLPTEGDRLAQLVESHWALLSKAETPDFLKAFRLTGQLNAFARYDDSQLWSAIEARKSGSIPEAADLKSPEYKALTNPSGIARSVDFRAREVAVPPAHSRWLERVVLAERLREVRTLIGFTRIESLAEMEDQQSSRARRAPISRHPPNTTGS